jgi:uncharacterized membrane protein YqjE
MIDDQRAVTPQVTTAELLERLSADISTLVRDEMELATAELKRKGAKAGTGLGISGAGGLLAVIGLFALTASAILGLSIVLAPWLSALIVGLVLLLVAAVLAKTGIGQLRAATPPVPEQAISSTKRDVQTLKESVRR